MWRARSPTATPTTPSSAPRTPPLGYDLTVGDLNGDGEDDLVVSAYFTDVSSSLTDAGAAYVVYGPIADDLSLPADADLTVTGVAAFDNTGRAISAEGDVNGDGVDDLLISAYLYDPDGRSNAGGVALVYGSTSARTGSLTFTTGDALWAGAAASDSLGTVAQLIGDFNGDGYDDIVIGGNGVDLAGSSSGRDLPVRGLVHEVQRLGDLRRSGRHNLRGVGWGSIGRPSQRERSRRT
ncbi:MAG: FG-GAP repeat protein [Deltaproteobacteria bacterium]|nr:FG-GAP repeat protein [Deltaproteobacteria bacterium]